MTGYFVVRSGEDGTVIRGPVTEAVLLAELDGDAADTGRSPHCLDRIPDNDGGYWLGVPEGARLIIRGEIVVPRGEMVVRRHRLDPS